ncbi:hypothetical protein DUNSADRAFT_13466 [Dunaliella salina]|uniref:PX domain-containing protein n=1 Tax=Dunaliella salina TaxID=3046 RepID=A0ABQ7G9A1_DUNSA|nr:hypothetical protein DUNSADRAFT_13466 [Dunaliella salina]|eukprot:KAF5831189.1 hypothetical protein DUNSADRAFT_13466 [Dunaliella salina]
MMCLCRRCCAVAEVLPEVTRFARGDVLVPTVTAAPQASLADNICLQVETTTALGIKKSHVQYVIRVDSSIPGMIANGVEVRRRFSDFDALHKILKHEYEGFFLPPLPEKSYIDGRIARESFLRLRRADLQSSKKDKYCIVISKLYGTERPNNVQKIDSIDETCTDARTRQVTRRKLNHIQ